MEYPHHLHFRVYIKFTFSTWRLYAFARLPVFLFFTIKELGMNPLLLPLLAHFFTQFSVRCWKKVWAIFLSGYKIRHDAIWLLLVMVVFQIIIILQLLFLTVI